MTKIIVITSGKGGVGKTTTAINLGAAINHFGEEVVVIDANLSTPNVGIHLGSPEVPVSLNHVMQNKAEMYEAVYKHESGLKIIPSSISMKESDQTDTSNLKNFKKEIRSISDYVIVDSAAGLGEEALSAMDLADEIIIVTNPEMPAITDALKAVKCAEKKKKPILGVIVTRVKKNNIEMQSETVREMLEVPILGMIPEDECVSESLSMKNAVVHTHPKSKASRAYKEIAAKITGKHYNSKDDEESIFEKIAKVFSKNRF